MATVRAERTRKSKLEVILEDFEMMVPDLKFIQQFWSSLIKAHPVRKFNQNSAAKNYGH